MPIQSDDIKLLESAVMADVPEGGGAMTGNEVVDGLSNNLFPDTSTDDRAAGRVNFRKVFGVAHTTDTDTLLGASFAVLVPPEDPLVHVTLFETPGWSDERDTARELVERYLVKGPRMSCRLMDTHYAGAIVLQMYQVGGTDFPAAGDAVALRNPSGQEQYVRVLKVTLSTGNFTVSEGSSTVSFQANIAVCEIGQPLQFDVLGPPIGRVLSESAYALVFSTSASTGVAFHGVKPLAALAEVGDRSVLATGGIYSPIVPAATIEEPLVDIAPLSARSGLARTAAAPITLPGVSLTLTAGTVLRLPTAVEPNTLTMQHGATSFTADPDGTLRQGELAVGQLDHKARTITMAAGSPTYGLGINSITYRPATIAGASVHSDFWNITTSNQGLGWVYAFQPPPAPGTLSVSYMAQGRWYELSDNGAGKLAGADSSYGAGTLNFTTGSMAVTLGALPDVGSALIFQWGNADAARAASAPLPTRAHTDVLLPFPPEPGTLELAWSRGPTNYTASVNAAGVVTGPADVGPVRYVGANQWAVSFAPHTTPDSNVTVEFNRLGAGSTAFTNNGGGSYTLTDAPVRPGSVRFQVLAGLTAGQNTADVFDVYSDGGLLRCNAYNSVAVVGTINNATGAIVLNNSVGPVIGSVRTTSVHAAQSGNSLNYESRQTRYDLTALLLNAAVSAISYQQDSAGAAESVVHTPAWRVKVDVPAGYQMLTSDVAFAWAGTTYTAQGAALLRNWNHNTGAGLAAGAVDSGGTIGISGAAPGASNLLTWFNAAENRGVDLLVQQGTFRVQSAPIKVGSFQLQAGALVGNANNAGVLSGQFAGTVDFQRGIVKWSRSGGVLASALTYNAVFLQYLPLDGSLLGLETARLPLDGRVPMYRPGGQVIVHNTLATTLPNPVVRNNAYSLGRQRIAAVVVRTVAGVKVPGSRYEVDFNLGTITFPVAADLTGFDQPFTVHHRIEDELMVLRADISGRLDLVSGLTHDYPANTSFVSSKLRKGDLFARAFNFLDRSTWAGSWQATADATAQPTASYNGINFPPVVTNRGAIAERWAVIFTGATQVRVVGETVGQVLTGVSTGTAIAPLNTETGVPYFSIPPEGWGGGWAVGNVLLFETAACGAPSWVARTVLQGPPTVASDAATIAFRADVDA
jgi:hypothetical protein